MYRGSVSGVHGGGLGYVLGLLSSMSFGLIPLFSLPMMSQGVSVSVVLMYRFLLAAVIVWSIVLFRREHLGVSWRTLSILLLLSLLYFGSALFLLEGYNYMPSGVATVLHFCYPTFVVLLMYLFFRQRIRPWQMVSVILAVMGVGCISGVLEHPLSDIPLVPILIVLLSGLCYAAYIVVLQRSRLEPMSTYKLTAYVMTLSTMLFALYGGMTGFSPRMTVGLWGYVGLLALIPTVCSNVLLVLAIQRIGPTPTAIMGALEPLTAVMIGALFLGENLSLGQGVGIVVILVAVLLLVLTPHLERILARRV